MKKRFSSSIIIISALLIIIVCCHTKSVFAQNCSCTEYVYLNEVTNGGSIHKFAVATDGTLTEVGSPWYSSADWPAQDQMPSPHGLGYDLNGYLYIGEGFGGDIRRLTCDGEILPESDFVIREGGFNIATIGNTLYVNSYNNSGIQAFDLCTGANQGYVCLDGGDGDDWGFYVDDNGVFYATHGWSANGGNGLYVFTPTEADFTNNTCFERVMVNNVDYTDPVIGDIGIMPTHNVRGVTTDSDGNIYIVQQFDGAELTNCARIYKYSPTYELLAVSAQDCTESDGTGWYHAIGIIYSETCNCLFVSTESPLVDCVTMFNLDLTQATTAVPPTGTGQDAAKGIAIQKECCPTPANLVIDTVLCNLTYPSSIFLQDLINCDGVICGGDWDPDPNNTGFTFNSCDNSVTVSSSQACGTFTLSGPNTQCGEFSVTINIETANIDPVTASGDQTLCPTDTPAELTATTTTVNPTYQWQMSTTSCDDGWANIDGAAASTYTPTSISATTYYRVVTAVTGTCATGQCEEVSNCVTLSLGTDCTPACTNPTVTAYALAASCTNGVPNDDGYLQISAAADATHYNYIMGSDYSTGDADIANATALGTLPLQFGTLANPTGTQDYTIRVFNGASDCFTDVTVILQEQDCTTTCSCDEYIYLNEPFANATLKFLINPDGSITEITNPVTGGYWADELTVLPHGLGADLNGYLYIGNIELDANDVALAGVDRYSCDGTLLQEDIIPPASGNGTNGSSGYATNIYSIGNTLYMNNWERTGYTDAMVFAYDICTGNLLGEYVVCDDANNINKNWDFYVNEATNQVIINTGSGIAIGDLDANFNGDCIPITITTSGYGRGITLDNNGNFYVRGKHVLAKYDSNGTQLWSVDLTINGGSNAWGLVYSETTGYLYLAGNDADCISVYNPDDGSYIMQGVPNPGGDSKAIAILNECCPVPNRQTLSQTYCVSGSNEQLFLNELFPCDGVICEGQWIPADATAEAVYNSCDQSISENIAAGCYSFTKGSDGLENYPKCGAFQLDFNLEILAPPEITLSADETICNGGATTLSITTTATDIQWQMSTTSCTEGFTNIDGATSATYTTAALSDTTYYRAIVNATGTCSDGSCPFESACITVSVDPNCAPPACTNPTTPVINLTDNDCDAGTAGSFAVATACGAGSHIEWSTDSGATWSTTTPTYSTTTAMNVVARCVDDADATCVSENSNALTSSPTDCGTCKPKCLKATIIVN